MNDTFIEYTMLGFNAISEYMKVQNSINQQIIKNKVGIKKLNRKMAVIGIVVSVGLYFHKKQIDHLTQEIEELKQREGENEMR